MSTLRGVQGQRSSVVTSSERLANQLKITEIGDPKKELVKKNEMDNPKVGEMRKVFTETTLW